MRTALLTLVAVALACVGGSAFAGAYQFSDGLRSIVVPAGDCYAVGQGYLAQVQGSLGTSYSAVLAACSTDAAGNVTGASWDVWNLSTGAHVGTYSAALTQTAAFADVPGAPFNTADFSFVFSTIFVATLGLYFTAYAIRAIFEAVRKS